MEFYKLGYRIAVVNITDALKVFFHIYELY